MPYVAGIPKTVVQMLRIRGMYNLPSIFTALIVCFVTAIGIAQENPTAQPARFSQVPNGAPPIARTYDPTQVKVLGDIEYGESKAVPVFSPGAPYRAFVFSGYGGDQVEIIMKGVTGPLKLAVADSTLNQIATGSSYIRVSLPYKGPDVELWYIITDNTPGRVLFQVRKTGHPAVLQKLGLLQ